MPTNPGKPPRPRGRPSKQEEVRRTLAEIGVDPEAIDVRRILAGIASNRNMPPTARVAACRALLLGQRDHDPEDAGDAAAQINDRAIARMRAN